MFYGVCTCGPVTVTHEIHFLNIKKGKYHLVILKQNPLFGAYLFIYFNLFYLSDETYFEKVTSFKTCIHSVVKTPNDKWTNDTELPQLKHVLPI